MAKEEKKLEKVTENVEEIKVEAVEEETAPEATEEVAPEAAVEEAQAEETTPDAESTEETAEASDESDSKPRVSLRNKLATKWYVVTIQSGHEASVANSIRQRVRATETDNLIEDILVPVQKKIVVKKGKQEVKEEKIFPGYILLKMILNEQTWELITNTEGVRGFVRTDKYPRPLPENEVQAIMKFMQVEQPAYQVSFSVGDAVKITEGAFADFIGSVQEIDDAKGKVKVLISFLGREAPVELDFAQVNRL